MPACRKALAMQITFQRDFEPDYGRPVQVSPRVRRVTANNPGPMTFFGTNTFLVGRGTVAVIDPGPDDPAHREALLAALGGERVSHILLTHGHFDHSGGAPGLAAATEAPILAAPPITPRNAGARRSLDHGLQPDVLFSEGSRVSGDGWTLEAVATPGHLSDHLCFGLHEENLLFSGDHVMAWSTTVVVPPHGSMRDYRASLARLLSRTEDFYLPAHGAALREARAFVRALLEHREEREREILASLSAGPATPPEIVEKIYPGLDAALRGAAAASVEAHLVELFERGAAEQDASGRYGLKA